VLGGFRFVSVAAHCSNWCVRLTGISVRRIGLSRRVVAAPVCVECQMIAVASPGTGGVSSPLPAAIDWGSWIVVVAGAFC